MVILRNLHYKSTSYIIYHTTKLFLQLKINKILNNSFEVKRGQKEAKRPNFFFEAKQEKKKPKSSYLASKRPIYQPCSGTLPCDHPINTTTQWTPYIYIFGTLTPSIDNPEDRDWKRWGKARAIRDTASCRSYGLILTMRHICCQKHYASIHAIVIFGFCLTQMKYKKSISASIVLFLFKICKWQSLNFI